MLKNDSVRSLPFPSAPNHVDLFLYKVRKVYRQLNQFRDKCRMLF